MSAALGGAEEQERRVPRRHYPPKTPRRSVRVPQDVWDRCLDRAAENGETVTDVVRRALREYAR